MQMLDPDAAMSRMPACCSACQSIRPFDAALIFALPRPCMGHLTLSCWTHVWEAVARVTLKAGHVRVLIRFENMTTKPSSCKLSNDQCPTTSEPIKAHILIHEGMNASGMTICPSRNAKCGKSNTGCLPHTHKHMCMCACKLMYVHTRRIAKCVSVCICMYVCMCVRKHEERQTLATGPPHFSKCVQQPRKNVLAWQEKAYVCICARIWAGEGVCM